MRQMPEATGDIREIVDQARQCLASALCFGAQSPPQPVFLPLYNLFLLYGPVFRLSFGPKSFVVVSDPHVAKSILLTNAKSFSKGLLAEILEFVMGNGLIPADGEIWRVRRRAILPSLHRRYVEAMVTMFGECALHGAEKLRASAEAGQSVEMENFFSRLSLDIIGKAVFNYTFDSLTHDDPVISAVYTVLREAEHRSIAIFPYWNLPGIAAVVPRQRAAQQALLVINSTLDALIADCRRVVEASEEEFVEEYLNQGDPSILRFLVASGEQTTSKQLRDDLMTMLIAGHETTAALLTWTFYLLVKHPEDAQRLREEVDDVLGDRLPSVEDLRALRFTTRVINEARALQTATGAAPGAREASAARSVGGSVGGLGRRADSSLSRSRGVRSRTLSALRSRRATQPLASPPNSRRSRSRCASTRSRPCCCGARWRTCGWGRMRCRPGRTSSSARGTSTAARYSGTARTTSCPRASARWTRRRRTSSRRTTATCPLAAACASASATSSPCWRAWLRWPSSAGASTSSLTRRGRRWG